MGKPTKEILVKKYKDSSLDDLRMAEKIRYERALLHDFTDITKEEEDQFFKRVLQEINYRFISMCKQVYEIGWLLVTVKRVIGANGDRKFCKWVENNLPFCHRTANNFMRVYIVCMGRSELVSRFPRAILYKIASDNFPEELREELFDNLKIG